MTTTTSAKQDAEIFITIYSLVCLIPFLDSLWTVRLWSRLRLRLWWTIIVSIRLSSQLIPQQLHTSVLTTEWSALWRSTHNIKLCAINTKNNWQLFSYKLVTFWQRLLLYWIEAPLLGVAAVVAAERKSS